MHAQVVEGQLQLREDGDGSMAATTFAQAERYVRNEPYVIGSVISALTLFGGERTLMIASSFNIFIAVLLDLTS